MFSVGILAFIFMDVTKHGEGILETGLDHFKAHSAGFGHVIALFSLLALGFTVGTAGISALERRLRPRRSAPAPLAGGEAGAIVGSEQLAQAQAGAEDARRRALQTGMVIATAIGLHNFAEGLAIGQSAASNQIALATMLVIGFALHNATEGFGIVAPLAADVDADGTVRRPSWRFLLTMALIGGGPTFVGTAVGHGYTSVALSEVFLTLAAGSIIYVVCQLLGVAARAKRSDLLAYGILVGLLAGFATDAIVTAAGV
jgi:ZIP family zinc transporter